MKDFLQRFGQFVVGVLHGFDRLCFRGSKRQLCHVAGLMSWLGVTRILLKEYKTWVHDTTVTLCRAIEAPAVEAGLYRFLNNSQDSKEQTALQMAAERKQTQGLIAVLGCVEPCQVVQVRGNPHTKKLELQVELAKCKHYYHYYLDPHYGLRYTRLQTWLPFTMHVGLNGRDWLGRQLDEAGIKYRKKDKGVADLHHRAEVSSKINDRLACSLATVEESASLAELTKDLGKRTQWKGRPVRALNPLAPADVALLAAVSRGEFLIAGFRNRDIRAILYGDETSLPEESKRQSGKVTRLLRLLRGHGIIAKIAKTHRYQLTEKGRNSLAALSAARKASTKQLLEAA